MVTKRKTKVICGETLQLSLCFFIDENEPAPSDASRTLDRAVAEWMSSMLDGLDREKLAAEVTNRIGRRVTKTQIDQWVAPSQTDRHPPADALLAIMLISGQTHALDGMAALMGRKTVTHDEAICAEFGALALLQQQASSRQKLIRSQMDDVLAGQILNRMKRSAA